MQSVLDMTSRLNDVFCKQCGTKAILWDDGICYDCLSKPHCPTCKMSLAYIELYDSAIWQCEICGYSEEGKDFEY